MNDHQQLAVYASNHQYFFYRVFESKNYSKLTQNGEEERERHKHTNRAFC